MAVPPREDRFTVEASHAADALVLVLAGELDHDTAEPLRQALEAALADGAARVLVDFSDVEFCDSTGLNALLQGRLEAQKSGSRIEIAGLRPSIARMFRITGADGVFTVHPDMAGALADRPQTA
ncbi:STAS domain-containing protein [Streptomyces sp. NPDC060031]|uniref:STAS domain-containing protein n=1 Tax=Streptomyces sp. NPDC060031 TaxID=3347043 RepID=UPI0036760B3C